MTQTETIDKDSSRESISQDLRKFIGQTIEGSNGEVFFVGTLMGFRVGDIDKNFAPSFLTQIDLYLKSGENLTFFANPKEDRAYNKKDLLPVVKKFEM